MGGGQAGSCLPLSKGASMKEMYVKNQILVVVHKRKNGQVYYHSRVKDDMFTPQNKFCRMDEESFDYYLKKKGFAKFEPDKGEE